MRKKLRPAEIRILNTIPKDKISAGHTFKGQIIPADIPSDKKNRLHSNTIHNLYEMGLIEHGWVSPYTCPIRLTEKGKEALKEVNHDQSCTL